MESDVYTDLLTKQMAYKAVVERLWLLKHFRFYIIIISTLFVAAAMGGHLWLHTDQQRTGWSLFMLVLLLVPFSWEYGALSRSWKAGEEKMVEIACELGGLIVKVNGRKMRYSWGQVVRCYQSKLFTYIELPGQKWIFMRNTSASGVFDVIQEHVTNCGTR